MVKILWSERQQKLFSFRLRANPSQASHQRRLRTLFRLIKFPGYVECSFQSFQNSSSIVRHRVERIIGGRCYLIEVAMVDDKRWRANLLRIPGVPAAMMPFYGATPDEAATHLTDWLDRAHQVQAGRRNTV
jgi:hypothetical protein